MGITGKQLLPHLLHQLAFFTRANSRKAAIDVYEGLEDAVEWIGDGDNWEAA